MQGQEQIAAALRARASLGADTDAEAWLRYAFGWILASAIVSAHYRPSAVDALPVYHPEYGWDRFLLTRRVSCQWCGGEPADSFGLLLLGDDDGPRLVASDGTRDLPLGPLLRNDPARALASAEAFVSVAELPPGDHTECWHERAPRYPALYHSLTDLIVLHPDLIVAREIPVVERQDDGSFHPLFLHMAARTSDVVYNWFAVENAAHRAFVRIDGEQSVYARRAGGWSTVRTQLAGEDEDGMKRRIRAWLRIGGTPDAAVD